MKGFTVSPDQFKMLHAMLSEQSLQISNQIKEVNGATKELFKRINFLEISHVQSSSVNEEKWRGHEERSNLYMDRETKRAERIEAIVRESMQTNQSLFKSLPCKDHVAQIEANTKYIKQQQELKKKVCAFVSSVCWTFFTVVCLGVASKLIYDAISSKF